jgi:hypothetical protein
LASFLRKTLITETTPSGKPPTSTTVSKMERHPFQDLLMVLHKEKTIPEMRKELLVVSPIISMGLLKLGHSQSLLHESRLSRPYRLCRRVS